MTGTQNSRLPEGSSSHPPPPPPREGTRARRARASAATPEWVLSGGWETLCSLLPFLFIVVFVALGIYKAKCVE